MDDPGLAGEQRELLGLIDKLQFAQLDHVKLPQIAVVGDQSAGKSSVLEALSGIPFPRDAGACTRFATEIRLRRAKEDGLTVSVIPDKSRPWKEQERLLQYGRQVSAEMPFEAVMRQASDLISPRHLPGRFAARDILVIEKTGPQMPLLTLVDLPGLVRVANRDQSEADIRTIEDLSDHYAGSRRTIILAVIGGNNDYVQAPILKKARRFDPRGSRTVGVLTKPDMTERIGLEDKFIQLVTNQDPENRLQLGWYVLLNPGPGESWSMADERSRRETDFFSHGRWSALPPQMCGVAALRQCLSSLLQKHIGKHIGSLRRQIQQALEQCEGQLRAMGPAGGTLDEMRFQMGDLFRASDNLVKPAVNGDYKNPFGERFFARQPNMNGTPSHRLRARVRDESERFSHQFRRQGRGAESSSASRDLPTAGPVGDRCKRTFARNEVEPLLRQMRGNELPLDTNPRAPYILFRDYSRNWLLLAQEYKERLAVICNEFLSQVVDHVWPMRMREPLRQHFLEPKMKTLVENSDRELARLGSDLELEMQPYDPEYEDRLRTWRARSTEEGAAYSEADEVLEKMLIYYDLTARIFSRNVITQVVERHLLLGLLGLFDPTEILRFSDESIELIAAEDEETGERRMALEAQRAAIEEARTICAGLAMRSDLRPYDDETEEETDREEAESETEEVTASREPPREPLWHPSRRGSRKPVAPPQDGSDMRPVFGDGSHPEPGSSRELGQMQSSPAASPRNQPVAHAVAGPPPPPPPPRTSHRLGVEDAERIPENMGSSGSRVRESTRSKLAAAMRLGT